MAVAVIMPKQGQTVESCIITKWHKQKGDKVEVGDLLFSYETDKASFDEEAKVSGVLLDIFFEEGEDVPVLTNVCVIGAEGESTQEFNPKIALEQKSSEEPAKEESETQTKAATYQEPSVTVKPGENLQEVKISPRARNLANKLNLDYRFATPTGPEGRIIERDILELEKSGPIFTPSAMENVKLTSSIGHFEPSGIGGRVTISDIKSSVPRDTAIEKETMLSEAEYEDVNISNIRKVIAKAMHLSLSTTAQLTLHTSFDATTILEFRKKVKENKEKFLLENITLNDMVLFAVSRTLPRHKALNAHFLDDKMRYFRNVHLGVAIDTERGLIVPTIFNANLKSLNQISKEVKKLAEECKKGTVNPDFLKGASFTVTNLGALGIEDFTPILNPPQTGILGVNTIVYRLKEVNGEMKSYPAMGLSLTFDHRALDGADAARFLQDLKNSLENFTLLLTI